MTKEQKNNRLRTAEEAAALLDLGELPQELLQCPSPPASAQSANIHYGVKKRIAVGADSSTLCSMTFPKKEPILPPILAIGDLVEVYATRGLGKTLFCMSLAVSLAAGVRFLKWEPTRAFRVLYVDGELQGTTFQERHVNALRWAGVTPEQVGKNFVGVTPDLNPQGMLNLSTKAGQEWLEPLVQDAEIILLDSYLTLAANGDPSKAELWKPMEEYLRSLRLRGKCAIFVHHAGKGGDQLGTITRETILDTVLALRPCKSLDEIETSMLLEFTKARSFREQGEELKLSLSTDGWAYVPLMSYRDQQIRDYYECGMTQQNIANELGLSQGYVSKILRKLGLTKKRNKKPSIEE